MSTPPLQHHQALKKDHPDRLVMLRMGDFYEFFCEDARLAAKALGLTLGSHCAAVGEPVPMTGVPCHRLPWAVGELIEKGFRLIASERVNVDGGGHAWREIPVG